MRLSRPLAFALVALAACSDPPTEWTARGPVADGLACNPLAPEWDCLMPYPCDFYRKSDPSLPGGHRLELPERARLVNRSADPPQPFDFFEMFPSDGFSVLPQIGLRPGGLVDTSNLVFHTGDLGASLQASSRTLLLDADTGEAIPHFVEYDLRPPTPEDRTLFLRPVRRLQHGHRYIVALRGLVRPGGALVEAPSGFRKLRDDDADTDALERLQDYYDARIFPVLEKSGVARAELQLAWDFTTQSEANATGDLLRARALAVASFEAEPPRVTVTEVKEYQRGEPDGDVRGRVVRGTIRVPLYTVNGQPDAERVPDDASDDTAGARLFRDASGQVAQNGWKEAPFTLVVPRRVLEAGQPARILQYGHGFFGGRDELLGYASRFANDTGMVILGVDWTGSASADAVVIFADLFTDPASTFRFVERTHQGMVDFLALAAAAKGPLASIDALQANGKPLLDAAGPVYYYGISQGSILGTTYVSLAPHVERAALSVGGASFGFMMSRSRNFTQFLGPIDTVLGDAERKAEGSRLVMLMQTAFDRIDPITYAPYLRTGTPGAPKERHVLLQVGLGDAQVPNLASHVHARAIGAPLLAPAPRPIWGLEEKPGPLADALVEFDFGIELDPGAQPVEADNPVHEGVRRTGAAIEQIDAFFQPGGLISATCRDGAGALAACVCRGEAQTCNPLTCSPADDRCEGNDVLACDISTGVVSRTPCANGCDAAAGRCKGS